MGLFKKKENVVITELKCTAEGCSFLCIDNHSLKRHIEWKHPEMTMSSIKTDDRVK
ncbi:hypothetical protein ACFLYQ_00155 [Chloroflexota bacterium]